MIVTSIGIVGHGHFGAFIEELVGRFFPTVEIRIFSRRATPDNRKFFNLEETASADVVVLCGAIREYEAHLLAVLPHLKEDAVVVDVATVKKYPTEIFHQHAASRRWISCHPMFGPESYKKTGGDVTGFRIVVTDYTLVNNDFLLIKDFLQQLGFLVIEMSADEHDQLLAQTLFLTHYIGQTVHAAGFGRTDIDTVSFNSLMNAVESVVPDKRLFEDVYAFNPHCQAVVDSFRLAQTKVAQDFLTKKDDDR